MLFEDLFLEAIVSLRKNTEKHNHSMCMMTEKIMIYLQYIVFSSIFAEIRNCLSQLNL